MHKRINVCIYHEVYAKLKDRGRFGESFSELISRIIDEADKISFENKTLEAINCNA
jgi:predicted CopG family antitoxin